MGEIEIREFLSRVAEHRAVAPSTQNRALNAILFLFGTVLKKPLGDIGSIPRAKRSKRLPVVLSKEEVQRVLAHLQGAEWLMASLLSGTGLRLMECLSLRVIPEVKRHLPEVQRILRNDRADGFGETTLP